MVNRANRRRGSRALSVTILLALVAVLGGIAAPSTRAAEWVAPSTVWVEQSGHTVDGLFLDEWRAYPSFLGLPLTEELQAKVPVAGGKSKKLTVQYFENLAIAYSPADERGEEWTVHALPLGKDALAQDQKDPRGPKLIESGTCAKIAATECRRFAETGHTVRWGFKAYWEEHGGEPLLGLPLTEEFVGNDGRTIQYFERAVLLWKKNQDVEPRAIGKEATRRLDLTTKKITQPDGIPAYDESLFVPPVEAIGGGLGNGPGPIQGGYKEIVVSISQQAMWAYEDGSLVISSLVSTGVGNVPETVTPTGYFSVLVKYDVQTMEGTISDEYYNVPDVPWVMYFDNSGNALHGTYWHNNFGTPMSHGCVNLPLDVAEFLYGWAPEGTPVTVID